MQLALKVAGGLSPSSVSLPDVLHQQGLRLEGRVATETHHV